MTRPIYLDTNIIIAAFETTGDESNWAWIILDAVTSGSLSAVTSELTLAELLPKPPAVGSQLFVELYSGLLKNGGVFSVSAVTRTLLVRSAHIRATDPVTRLPDAIHIATALERNCLAFVTNERRLKTPAALPLVRLSANSLRQIATLAQ